MTCASTIIPRCEPRSTRDDTVVPVFCFDDRLLHGRHASGPRTQFLLESLADLRESLDGQPRDPPRSRPSSELVALAAEVGAGEVHFSADSGPFARRRMERVWRALRQAEIEPHAHPGLHVVDDLTKLRTKNGKPYTVFSPFHRSWLEVPRRELLRPPPQPALPAERTRQGTNPVPVRPRAQPGGERAASGRRVGGRERLAAFLREDVERYTDNHDALGRDRTSRLSPYLHFGCISPREIEERLPGGEGAEAFRRQLCWRDFYHHVLREFPRNARSEFQERYRGSISWSYAEKRFEAWCDGRTGYPLVDAAMRQLGREGWMHNRARLVVGSFLTKHLGIDWRWGERWFMRLLVDGDEANNNGNWQWIASVGVDPQPFFRRIYNPTLHMERYDPEGRYVRRYVEELRNVPDDYLREPWTMPDGRSARGGLRDRRGLSRADRRPPRGAPGGVRALRRGYGRRLLEVEGFLTNRAP